MQFLLPQELTKIPGIGKVKAIQLLALAEISKRMNLEQLQKKYWNFILLTQLERIIGRSADFYPLKKSFLLLLTNAHTLIKEVELSSGTVNQTYLSPREIFIHALRYEAVHIVLVHNHPSGRVTPSEADIQSTLRIRDAGQLLGIQVSDHIIVAGDHYLSMLERGIL